MRRLTSAVAAVAFVVLAAVPIMAGPAAAQTTGVPTSVAACKHGGWRTLVDPVGAPFTSRAACIRWAGAHPGGQLSLADLSGTFTGTEAFTFECTFVHQTFDATYPSRGRVGVATLAIEGCVDGSITTYTGTFTITTSLGSVSGTAVGTLISSSTLDFHLTLTATAASGSFSGLVGSLVTDIRWNGFPDTVIKGTIAPPPAP